MTNFRRASSLILVAPDFLNAIRILMVQRSSTSSHFPDAYVFPGGNCDSADTAQDWLSVLPPETHNVPLNITKIANSNQFVTEIPEAISCRITAIRETFEESGLLLCQRMDEEWSPLIKHLQLSNADIWRQKVRGDASEFLNLCRSHDCFPNIRSLYLLNNWISPTTLLRRYDARFFVAVMEKIVNGVPDYEETKSLEVREILWNSVQYFLDSDHVYLPPPQYYEFTMLSQFQNVNALFNFAQSINSEECVPMTPIHINASDGMVFLFYGDDIYETVKEKNLEHVHESYEKYLEQLMKTAGSDSIEAYRANKMHRVELKDGKCQIILKNFCPRNFKNNIPGSDRICKL